MTDVTTSYDHKGRGGDHNGPGGDGSSTEGTMDVPRTLEEGHAPRNLGLLDQLGMWGNLGISLLGFAGALVVLDPLGDGQRMGLGQAMFALVLGTLIGTAGTSAMAYASSTTGHPAMVMLRGLFGGRLSYVPTVLNVVQLVGWGTFEMVTMSIALRTIWDVPKIPVAIAIGVVSILLSLYPLHWVKVLRKYVTVAVVIVLIYLGIRLGSGHLPTHDGHGWHGFSIAVDAVIGLSISWVPLAGDYARHSRTNRDAVLGSYVGYVVTQIGCYSIGIMTLLIAHYNSDNVFHAITAVTLGTLCFLVLALREIDQCFVDVYSGTVSIQNLLPRVDRRVVTIILGVLMTALALAVDIYGFTTFLSLIASVFVPLLGVFLVDYYLFGGRRRWNVRADSPSRPLMLVAWICGFIAYQMLAPAQVGGWSSIWEHVDSAINFTPATWMSASTGSFLVAVVVTVIAEVATRRPEEETHGTGTDRSSRR